MIRVMKERLIVAESGVIHIVQERDVRFDGVELVEDETFHGRIVKISEI